MWYISVLLLAYTWVTSSLLFLIYKQNPVFYLVFKRLREESHEYMGWCSVTDLSYQVTYDIIARIRSI